MQVALPIGQDVRRRCPMRLSADVYEEGEDLVVVIDLPGSRPREIEFLVDATLLCL